MRKFRFASVVSCERRRVNYVAPNEVKFFRRKCIAISWAQALINLCDSEQNIVLLFVFEGGVSVVENLKFIKLFTVPWREYIVSREMKKGSEQRAEYFVSYAHNLELTWIHWMRRLPILIILN